jgi:methanogenic corrinoid protein MtbC1
VRGLGAAVADEHAATGLSHRALLPLQEPLQIAPPRSRERAVLAAVEGQTHVLGLRMIADVLEGAGFKVLCLEADLPCRALQAFVAERLSNDVVARRHSYAYETDNGAKDDTPSSGVALAMRAAPAFRAR